MKKMQAIMDGLRREVPQQIAGEKIVGRSDYGTSERWDAGVKSVIPMPKSNVLSTGWRTAQSFSSALPGQNRR